MLAKLKEESFGINSSILFASNIGAKALIEKLWIKFSFEICCNLFSGLSVSLCNLPVALKTNLRLSDLFY